MHRIQFIHQPSASLDRALDLRAFAVSCVFHGVLLASMVGISFYYSSHLPPIKSGSAPGASVISLETMVITPSSPPPEPPKPAPVPTMPVLVAAVAAPPPPPLATVPVLAVQPTKPAPVTPVKKQAVPYPTIAHTTAPIAKTHPKPAASTSISSYAPGLNVMPHPPYPMEAQDRQETGTVYLDVQFDAQGKVVAAKVTQSSGVPILDSQTRSFIRTYWRCPEFAGQVKNVPVLYQLK